MAPPHCGPLCHHWMGKKINSCPENQSTPETTLSTTEPSHSVCWLPQRLTVNKEQNQSWQEKLTSFCRQNAEEKEADCAKHSRHAWPSAQTFPHVTQAHSHECLTRAAVGIAFPQGQEVTAAPQLLSRAIQMRVLPALPLQTQELPTAALTWAAIWTQQWQCFNYVHCLGKGTQKQSHAATGKVKHATIHITLFKDPLWETEYSKFSISAEWLRSDPAAEELRPGKGGTNPGIQKGLFCTSLRLPVSASCTFHLQVHFLSAAQLVPLQHKCPQSRGRDWTMEIHWQALTFLSHCTFSQFRVLLPYTM